MATPDGSHASSATVASGDYRIDSLLMVAKWDGPVGTSAALTFSFPTANSVWSVSYPGEPSHPGYAPFSAAQANAVREILQQYSEIANITFSEIVETSTSVGDLRFAFSGTEPAIGWAYGPGEVGPVAGDVWLKAGGSWVASQFIQGGGGYQILLHEIGHALGLKHPHEGNPVLPGAENNNFYTVMSYVGSDYGAVATPMLYDMLALQYLYGANMSTRAGNDVYTFDPARDFLMAIWDAGGNDTISAVNVAASTTLPGVTTIDLRDGELSAFPIYHVDGSFTSVNYAYWTIAYNAIIENAIGSGGDDMLIGNSRANSLTGNAGDDTLGGGAGRDTLDGGSGSDFASYQDASSVVTVTLSDTGFQATGGGGTDRLLGIEGLIGSQFNDSLSGGAGDDMLEGGAGNDLLDGGAGTDIASYAGAPGAVTLNMAAGSVSNTLHAGIDTLVGIEGLAGTGFADQLTGDDGANVLIGEDGNDTLNGAGGNDTFSAGDGDDHIDGGAGSDTLDRTVSEGYQTVDLTQGVAGGYYNPNSDTLVSIENVIGSDTWDHITGNGVANRLEGRADNDTLYGRGGMDYLDGGSGSDYMFGEAGNDTYVVDVAGDTVYEVFGEGAADTVVSSITYLLPWYVENLSLAGNAGIGGTGNELDNVITGNRGANVIDGDLGDDTMKGGAGHDMYLVDSAGDVVMESLGAGIDEIRSTVTLLALAENVEVLRLTGSGNLDAGGNGRGNTLYANVGNNVLDGKAGSDTLSYEFGAISGVTVSLAVTAAQATGGSGSDTLSHFESLTGSNLSDKLTGNSGNNALSGLAGRDTIAGSGGSDILAGGTGSDRLTGGAGADQFDFNTALNASTNVDLIADFATGLDLIRLDHDIFTSLGTGALAAGRFYSAPGAIAGNDASDRIAYNTNNGNLYYDPDGAGGAAATLFATLIGAPSIAAADFLVIA